MNSDGKIIREESIQKLENKYVLTTSFYLNRERTNEFTYSLHGDLLSIDNYKYMYKYDTDGQWVFMNRSGYLLKRVIY